MAILQDYILDLYNMPQKKINIEVFVKTEK